MLGKITRDKVSVIICNSKENSYVDLLVVFFFVCDCLFQFEQPYWQLLDLCQHMVMVLLDHLTIPRKKENCWQESEYQLYQKLLTYPQGNLTFSTRVSRMLGYLIMF